MVDIASFISYYEITDRNRSPEDDLVECSCGVVVWDVMAHIQFHNSLRQKVFDVREPA